MLSCACYAKPPKVAEQSRATNSHTLAPALIKTTALTIYLLDVRAGKAQHQNGEAPPAPSFLLVNFIRRFLPDFNPEVRAMWCGFTLLRWNYPLSHSIVIP